VELNETEFSSAKTVADVERLLQQPAAGALNTATLAGPSASPSAGCASRSTTRSSGPQRKFLVIAHSGPRKSPQLARTSLIVSNHITRRADIGLILAPFRDGTATSAIAMGGETLQEMRHRARLVYRQTLGLPTRLLVRHRPLQRFSAPAIFRLSREFSLCRRVRRPRLQRPGFSRRRSEQHGHRRDGPFQGGIGLLAGKSWRPHHSHPPRRRLADQA